MAPLLHSDGNHDVNPNNQQPMSDDYSTTARMSPGGRPHGEKEEKVESPPREDEKMDLKESDCYDKLGFSFSPFMKWTILTVIFAVQVSMNFNASIYGNAVIPLSEQFSISEQAARVGQMIFLIAYAFGSELWVPWSEEIGR